MEEQKLLSEKRAVASMAVQSNTQSNTMNKTTCGWACLLPPRIMSNRCSRSSPVNLGVLDSLLSTPSAKPLTGRHPVKRRVQAESMEGCVTSFTQQQLLGAMFPWHFAYLSNDDSSR